MCRLVFLFVVVVGAQMGAPAPAPLVRTAWDVLRHGLHDGSASKRREAVVAVGSIGNSREVLALVEGALQDKDVQVREAAASELGAMKSRESIPYLRQALKDEPEVAFAAARSLWAVGDHSGAKVLEGVLSGERGDGPGLVGGAMRDAHDRLHHPAQLATLGARDAATAFLGPASIGITVAQNVLKDKDAGARAEAAVLLGASRDGQAVAPLERALGDRNWAVRAAAAKSLGEAGSREAVSKLVTPMLDDSNDAVRYAAAASIIRLSAPPR